jgi:ubiquinone/menaquinone biosynthesis C-methylase UbiE
MSKERDLIVPGMPQPGGRWAELGSGTGIFTLTLRDVLGEQVEIFSVDRDAGALDRQRRAFAERYPDANIHFIQADFTHPLDLPPLDGILMANSLHFVKVGQQAAVLQQVCRHLKPDGGKLVIVEYNAERGNMWVPYPVSYDAFVRLATAAGLRNVRQLAAVPSRFLREMYSALGERRAS